MTLTTRERRRRSSDQTFEELVGDVDGGADGEDGSGVDDDVGLLLSHQGCDERTASGEDVGAQASALGFQLPGGVALEGSRSDVGFALALLGCAPGLQLLVLGPHLVKSSLQSGGPAFAGGTFVENPVQVDDQHTSHGTSTDSTDDVEADIMPTLRGIVSNQTSRGYFWRDLRFDVPAGFDDDSVLTFQAAGAVSLTVARDALTGTVDAYAREQEQAFKATKRAGYTAEGPRAVEGIRGAVVDRRFDDPGGAVVQRQAFVAGAKGVVVIVTGTARATAGDAAKKAVVDLVQTLKVGAS